MLDQSFSAHNFRTIMQAQNRKGIYVEARGKFERDPFLNTRIESWKILILNEKIKNERIRLKAIAESTSVSFDYNSYKVFKENVEGEKKIISENRELLLGEVLTTLSNNINHSNFKITIKKGEVKWNKQLYITEKSAENYFALKQTQYNIKKSFDAKQSSRALIVSQLVTLLKDDFPKVLVRADIKEFYETIPHSLLINKVNENSILSYPSKKIIKDVLNSYWDTLVIDGVKNKTDIRVGIPRGIGISAYLSELCMKDFDNEIKAFSNVTYYSRYVDDIIIIFTPESRTEVSSADSYKDTVSNFLNKKTGLQTNSSKTESVDLRKKVSDMTAETSFETTFLGYRLTINYKYVDEQKDGGIVRVMRKEPLEVGNKNNVFVGIYFSNQYLSQPLIDLIELDKILIFNIDLLLSTEVYLKERLQKFSFVKGFIDKSFKNYNIDGLNKILSIWK